MNKTIFESHINVPYSQPAIGRFDFNFLKDKIIDNDLCTRCGACQGVCPEGIISFEDRDGHCLPTSSIKNFDVCSDCPGWCYLGCSGGEVHFPTLSNSIFGKEPENKFVGNYNEIFVGFSKDAEIRRRAASGGLISTVASYLLDNKLVDGVISLAESSEEPWRFEPYVARTKEDVLRGAQSKYTISPVNQILSVIEKEPSDHEFAFVGIPCQVHSIRKLQLLNHKAAQKIKLFLGSFCGNILHFDSIKTLLEKHNAPDYKEISSLQFRSGEWPGHLNIKFRNGKVISLPKFYANYLIPMHMMQRCLVCTDLSNEFADISFGDAWAPEYEERGLGFSLAISRTEQGDDLLELLKKDGIIELNSTTEEEMMSMHSHAYDLKKQGAFIRMAHKEKNGEKYPKYGYKISSKFSRKRIFFEKFSSLIYFLFKTRIFRKVIMLLPDSFIGEFFVGVRKSWKKQSRESVSGQDSIYFEYNKPRLNINGKK